jgi:hypothetical protein
MNQEPCRDIFWTTLYNNDKNLNHIVKKEQSCSLIRSPTKGRDEIERSWLFFLELPIENENLNLGLKMFVGSIFLQIKSRYID